MHQNGNTRGCVSYHSSFWNFHPWMPGREHQSDLDASSLVSCMIKIQTIMSNQKRIHHMKHLKVEYHFIKKLIEDGTMSPIQTNVPDGSRHPHKPLSLMAPAYHTNRLGVVPPKLKEEC